MTIIIKDHRHPNASTLIKCPPGANAARIVEEWQKASIYYQVHGKLPACTWKIAEGKGIVSAMVEGARMS